jgi:hypothetical protein
MNFWTQIITESGKNAAMVEYRLRSIASDMEILSMNGAEVVSKINGLLDTDLKAELDEDQIIYFGALREQLLKILNRAEDASKNIK